MSSLYNEEHCVYVGFGGNIGSVPSAFSRALQRMPVLGLRPLRFSSLYRSKAQLKPGAPPQPDYWNAVCVVRTCLSPPKTLAALLQLEGLEGRERTVQWAPRVLDLDLLLYDEQVIELDGLTVPHARLHERLFVLQPLIDVAPELRLPNGEAVADVLALVQANTLASEALSLYCGTVDTKECNKFSFKDRLVHSNASDHIQSVLQTLSSFDRTFG